MEFLAGSISNEHGIYRNHCCGDELAIYRGIMFPNCKKHQEITARWQMVVPVAMGPRNGSQTDRRDPNSGNPAA
jgi:hypothetical protein